MGKRGKKGLRTFGTITFNCGLSCEVLSDFNNYILSIVGGGEKGTTKELYFSNLTQLFEKIYDLLVKRHCGSTDKTAIENIINATRQATNEVLEAIEKITGDSKMARIAGSVRGQKEGG